MSRSRRNKPTAQFENFVGPVNTTIKIVAAYISNNAVRSVDVPDLISSVYRTIIKLESPNKNTLEKCKRPTPAEIRKSVAPYGLISFLDGKRYKILRRHLRGHGLDPASYRERFGLPKHYPMVAADYTARRSELAKSIGLGRVNRPADKTVKSVGSDLNANHL